MCIEDCMGTLIWGRCWGHNCGKVSFKCQLGTEVQRKLGCGLPGLDLNFFLKKNLLWLKMSKGPWYVKWYVLLLSWNSASSLFLKIWESGHGDTIIIPALGTFLRLRKEDCKSQTSLGYTVRVRFHFNKPKQQENTTSNKINFPPPEILSLVFFK